MMPKLKMEIRQETPLPIGCGISKRKEMQFLDFVDQSSKTTGKD